MSTSELIIAGCLVVLGVAHSTLGEQELLRPLFSAEWTIESPRWAVERIFRFAWHLTSLAWFALAGIVAGLDALPIVGIMSLVSAAMIFVMLRGHLAWPLFLLAGLAAFYAEGWIGSGALQAGGGLTAAALVLAAGVHVYWAAGGQWMIDRALPKVEGRDFSPGPVATLAVAAALLAFAGLVTLTGFSNAIQSSAIQSNATPSDATQLARWAVMAGVAILTIRAVGDNKVAGFTKTDHSSPFGQADDQYFTPLIVLLALGATGALLA